MAIAESETAAACASSRGPEQARGVIQGRGATARTGSTGASGGLREARSSLTAVFRDEPKKIDSNMNVSQPQKHRLPTHVMFLVTVGISVAVALVNHLIVWADQVLLAFKFTAVQDVANEQGAALGAAVLAAISVAFVLVDACLVSFAAPICAGSGLPEIKGYLNGNVIPGLFKATALLVRVAGIILSVAAGLPLGREGPMVCIGGCLGYGIVHVLAMPHVRKWVKVNTSEEQGCTAALLVDEERFAHARRLGCALGGAAGIATAFNAPIGGILYMFEEATVTSWTAEMTFRAFVCTVCSTVASRGLLNLTGDDVHQLVVFADEQQNHGSWHWIDIPFFLLLSALAGAVSAFFSRCLLAVWSLRARGHARFSAWQPYAKVAEVIVFTTVCAFTWYLLPLAVDCEYDAHAGTGHRRRLGESRGESRRLGGGATLDYARHACEEGMHNEMATLFLSSAEGAVKHLFSRGNAGDLRLQSLAFNFVAYVILAVGLPGLPVPMGLFVPSLLIGALLGRFSGEALDQLGLEVASSGVYALMGSAAFLGGFTHMTIAVVVLVVEAANDLSLVSPLMLGIFVSHVVSKAVNRHAYDEVLILRKGVPFLAADIPKEIDHSNLKAADLLDPVPPAAMLGPMATIHEVQQALAQSQITDFPIVSAGACIGLAPRTRLEAALQARLVDGSLQVGRTPSAESAGSLPDSVTPVARSRSGGSSSVPPLRPAGGSVDRPTTVASSGHLAEEDRACSVDAYISGLFSRRRPSQSLQDSPLPVHRVMDPAPFVLLADMPVVRFYPLFTKSGTNVACIISNRGEFRGLLFRESLIAATSRQQPPRQPNPSDSSIDSGARCGAGGNARRAPLARAVDVEANGDSPAEGAGGEAAGCDALGPAPPGLPLKTDAAGGAAGLAVGRSSASLGTRVSTDGNFTRSLHQNSL